MTKQEASKKALNVMENSINNVHKKDRNVTDLVTTVTTMVSMVGVGMIIEMFLHTRHWNKEMDKAKGELEGILKEMEPEESEAEVKEEAVVNEQAE